MPHDEARREMYETWIRGSPFSGVRFMYTPFQISILMVYEKPECISMNLCIYVYIRVNVCSKRMRMPNKLLYVYQILRLVIPCRTYVVDTYSV